MFKRAMFLVIAAMALMVLAAGPVRAQFGALEGDLKDDNGKPMAGTRVVINRKEIKGTYTVLEKDTKKGHYYHGGLPLGMYNVIWMNGEEKIDEMGNVRVTMGDPVRIDFDLRDVKKRAAAAQAGGGSGMAGMSKEERDKAQAQLKAQQEQRLKIEKLGKSFTQGSEALQATKDQSALVARAGLTVQPGQPITPELRAAIEAEKAKALQEAVTQFQEAAAADPTQHAVFGKLGEAYVEIGRSKRGDEQQAAYKSAFEAYQKAISLNGDEAVYHVNYGAALANIGQMEQANAELTKAAQLDPKMAPMAYYNLGVILVNAGKMKEAAGFLKKSVEADPAYANSWYWLGMALLGDAQVNMKTGKITPAAGTIEAFQKYLELQPNGQNAVEAKAAIESLGATVQTEIKSQKAVKKRP